MRTWGIGLDGLSSGLSSHGPTRSTQNRVGFALRWLPLCWWLLLCAFRLPASDAHLAFQSLTENDGLSNGFVNDLLRDSRGFLWIATADGLNRYNGYDVRAFRHDPDDPTSIAGNWIRDIHEDSSGRIWVSFGIGGVDLFDSATESFRHVHTLATPAGAPSEGQRPGDHATAFAEDTTGATWIGTQRGLVRVQRVVPIPERVSEGAPTNLDAGVEVERMGGHLGSASILDVRSGPDGRLWVTTSRDTWSIAPGLSTAAVVPVLAPRSDGIESVRLVRVLSDGSLWFASRSQGFWAAAHPTRRWLRGHAVVEFAGDPAGNIWAVTAQGRLWRIEPTEDRVTEMPAPEPAANWMPATGTIAVGESGAVLVAHPRGVAAYDRARGSFVSHVYDPARQRSLGSDRVKALYQDDRGQLWIATWGGGVHRLHELAVQLGFEQPVPEAESPAANRVGALAVVGDRVWIGTSDRLVARTPLSAASNAWPAQWLSRPQDPRAANADGWITALHEGVGALWVGTNFGLVRLEETQPAGGPKAGQPVSIETVLRTPSPVNDIQETPDGLLWVCTPNGLFRFDPETGMTGHWTTRSHPELLPSDHVQCVTQTGDGRLWFGSYIGGLSLLDEVNGIRRQYVFDAQRPHGINSKSVTEVFEDSKGRLWVGTYSGGLNLLDETSGRFTHYTERDGLIGNRVCGIVEDDQGILWISTDRGLSRFDPEKKSFRSFDVHDGLQSNQFAERAAAVMPDGSLVFGGVHGINRFHPRAISRPAPPPPVVVTGLQRNEVPRRIADSAREATLQLGPKDDFLAFEFIALDFRNPRRNRYAYLLEGFDEDWVVCGARRYAAYANLDPGEYTFRVRAANSDGVWNETGASLRIHIQPPFYRTAWFYLLASATLAGLLLLAHWARLRSRVVHTLALERARASEREHIREEISKDYHDALGHKLTKISLYTELARRSLENGNGQAAPTLESSGTASPGHPATFLRKVADSVEALTRETRQFIWTIDPRKDSLYETGLQLREFGDELFENSGVDFDVEGLGESLREWRLPMRGKQEVLLLFREALHNCLKHAEATRVRLSFEVTPDDARITVEDDGVGLRRREANAAGDSRARSQGAGLSNMTSRAAALGGTLDLEPRDHAEAVSGTRVRLHLPKLANLEETL